MIDTKEISTKPITYLAVTGQRKKPLNLLLLATVIPSGGYGYFRPSQGAWNHITTYFI